jgi:hypothetical protein
LEISQLMKGFCDLDACARREEVLELESVANHLKGRICQMREEYNDSLLLREDLLFIFFDRPVADVVGKVVDQKQVNWNL